MKTPEGHITLADLAQDIAARTQPAGRHNGQKHPTKAEEGFPLDTLPLKLQELVKGAETALGMPPDFLAASCLLATAAAAGGTYQLQLKRGKYERPIFFLVLVGRPNVNKSYPLKFALQPIYERDGEQYESYKVAKAEYDAIAGMSKKERKEEGITEAPPKPAYVHTLINDATPEALAAVHQNNLRGITVHRDELAGWVKSFNRYHQGSEQEDWLTIWNGYQWTIDRISREPVCIKRPNISVAGTIQPAVIEELANGGRGLNGFIDRLLFCWPEGLEKPLWTEDEINLPLLEDYQDAITRLLDLTFDAENKAHVLTLEPDAKARLFQFSNQDNKGLCDTTENEQLAGIYGKFDVHTPRLVIVLHLLHWAYWGEGTPPATVTLQTVDRAIKAARYFRSQALKVFERLHNSSPLDKLPSDKQRLYDALPAEFKKADGEAIAERQGMPARTFRHFLTTEKGRLFESPSFGLWAKLY